MKRRALAAEIACLLLVILVGAVVAGLHMRDDRALSPIDEEQHVDYVIKAGNFTIPRDGETIGPETRHEIACRGIEAPGYHPPPCNGAETQPDDRFPEDAAATAAIDPPLYYFTTGVTARALRAVFHLDSIVTAARVAGIGWLALLVLMLWLLMQEMGVGLVARTAVGVLLVTTPMIVHSYAVVTSDSTLALGGAAMLWLVMRWERRRAPAWIVFAVAVLCALAKVTCLLGPAAAAAYLLVRALRRPQDHERTRMEIVRMAIATGGAAAATFLLWLLVAHIRRVPGAPTPPSGVFFHAAHVRLDQVVREAGAFLSPITAPPIVKPLDSPYTTTLLTVLNALVLAGAFGGAALAAARSRLEAVGASTAALMLLGGPVWVVLIYLSAHQVLPSMPHRYGLSLVPGGIAALGAMLGKAWMRWSVAGFAAVAALYTVGHLAAR